MYQALNVALDASVLPAAERIDALMADAEDGEHQTHEARRERQGGFVGPRSSSGRESGRAGYEPTSMSRGGWRGCLAASTEQFGGSDETLAAVPPGRT